MLIVANTFFAVGCALWQVIECIQEIRLSCLHLGAIEADLILAERA